MKNEKRERTTNITRLVVGMSVVNTLILTVVLLAVSVIFFFKQATSIYDEMSRAIAGEASTQVDKALRDELAEECNRIFEGLDDPKGLYDRDLDAYYAEFDSLTEHEGYEELQTRLNTLRKGTQATEIDLVIFYPAQEQGIYIMDARDVTIVPCGELFGIDGKYFDQETLEFKGFYSKSRYFGTLRTNGIPLDIDRKNGRCVYITADIPTTLINDRAWHYLISIAFFSLIMCVIITFVVTGLLKRQMVHPIQKISALAEDFVAGYEEGADKTAGSLMFAGVDGGRIDEIRSLLCSMQSMELEMNSYLADLKTATAEKERIATEMSLATRIQADMLPGSFPAFPDRKEFDIYASMTPAKEVGGDFYDFFLIDDDHLGLVMADVSGKGVPAALFMMASKILIQNFAMTGKSPAEVLKSTNDQICANNREEMFVTVWFGILDIPTGVITAANAGHEYPIIRKGDGGFALLKDEHGFVIGGMEGMKFKEYEIVLEAGDVLFLYTDGVAEATNAEDELFGTDRMLKALNKDKDASPEEILMIMKSDVDEFVGEAPQFDDLTMMAVKMLKEPASGSGEGEMNET